jgi:predicted PurR-regulated permease PerM
MNRDIPYTFDRVVRILISMITLVVIIYVFRLLNGVLLPFFIALLLAYLINPIVAFIQKLVKKRILAILITVIVLLALFIGFWLVVIPNIIGEISRIGPMLTKVVQSMDKPDFVPDDLEVWIKDLAQREEMKQYFTLEYLTAAARSVLPSIWSSVQSVFGLIMGLTGVIMVFLYFIFILLDFHKFSVNWKGYIPPKNRELIVGIIADLEVGMKGYFRAQSKIVLCVTIGFAVGFKIIGLPMGITLGILIGLLNYVPYLQWVGLPFTIIAAAMKSLETGNSFLALVGLVLLIFAIVQLIQEVLLTPKFMGDQTGMNPALMLLSLSIWGSLLGILGMIIALPLTTVIISYYKRYVLKEETEVEGDLKDGG